MPRQFSLVRHGARWQVCSQVGGTIDGKYRYAWFYGPPPTFFCLSKDAAEVVELPLPYAPNFFGDRYIHTIDQLKDNGDREVSLGGCNNAGAAQAAFDYLVAGLQPNRTIILRDGGRIMRKEAGKAVYDKLAERWLPAGWNK